MTNEVERRSLPRTTKHKNKAPHLIHHLRRFLFPRKEHLQGKVGLLFQVQLYFIIGVAGELAPLQPIATFVGPGESPVICPEPWR